MLDLIEKITAGVCGAIVLAVAGAYVLLGTPSPTPPEFVEAVKPLTLPTQPLSADVAEKYPRRAHAEERARALDRDEKKDYEDKLARQGHRNKRLGKPELMPIPPATFEFAQVDANWMRELKRYRSTILESPEGKTRLRVDGIRENTMLQKLGFEDGDVIELVDGEIMEFNEQSSMKYRSMFSDALDRLRSGESLTVTVTRDGQPVNLLFYISD